MFHRRPLTDAATALYGGRIETAAAGILADGLTGLVRRLRLELAELERSEERLRQARATAEDDRARTADLGQQLAADLESWRKDAQAATQLADAFGRLEETRAERGAAEERIVTLGRELRAAFGRLAAEIDRVAPAARSVPAASTTVGP